MKNIKKAQLKVDYLIVGAGITGSIFAHEATKLGKKVLVIDKRKHIGGNCYTENKDGIDVHIYGPHIFHTSNKKVWDYINKFTDFNNFINSPLAMVNNNLYNLPFNMNMFYQVFNERNPDKIKKIIESEKSSFKDVKPRNLEEQSKKLVGETIYNLFIKGYTEKQWGRSCTELRPEIIKRLPVRYTFNNNYFNDIYQGIPIKGYTEIFKKLLNGINLQVNTEFKDIKNKVDFTHCIYTGPIDEFFNYEFGELDYRTLKFDHHVKNVSNYQGNAVINYNDAKVPYTRIVEHKHFNLTPEILQIKKTHVTYEYSETFNKNIHNTRYYPTGGAKNQNIFKKYLKKSKTEKYKNITFCGRLGSYKYYDMDDCIEEVLNLTSKNMLLKY